MLAQVKLAWWRDTLAAAAPTASPDPVVQGLREAFGEGCAHLIQTVDAFERLVGSQDFAADDLTAFASGRAAGWELLAGKLAPAKANAADARVHGQVWALADFAARARRADDRALAVACAARIPQARPLPRALRPLAILSGLSRRALERGGLPLLGDRLSPFVAARIALSGR